VPLCNPKTRQAISNVTEQNTVKSQSNFAYRET